MNVSHLMTKLLQSATPLDCLEFADRHKNNFNVIFHSVSVTFQTDSTTNLKENFENLKTLAIVLCFSFYFFSNQDYCVSNILG